MLLGHSMPPVTGVATAEPGTAWLTVDGWAALFDGRPARRARLRWRGDGAAAPAPITITVGFARAFVPRVIALLGLSCGPGVRVEVRSAGGAGLGGNALSQRTVTFADGTVGLWIVTSGAVETSGLDVAIYNDRDGSAWANAASVLDIGEFVAMPAVDVELQPDWTDELVDPSDVMLGRAAQPSVSARRAYRRFEGTFTADTAAAVRGGALEGGTDWSRLRAAFVGNGRCALVPRWRTPAGAIDAAELNRTALYGAARMGPYAHLRGDYYSATIAAQEVPAIA